jgi:small GTP-binding protein
VKKLKIKG